jgi:hypothetical protein
MLRFVWEGRVVSYHGRNYVVIDKLGRDGNVILEAEGRKFRVMVHKSELGPRIRGKR